MKRLILIGGASSFLLALIIADSFRGPAQQIDGRVYVSLVHGYQSWLHPFSRKFVRCRFTPTCSEYSIEAVRALGIRQGLWLTAQRLHRCRKEVAFGTVDPVPTQLITKNARPNG